MSEYPPLVNPAYHHPPPPPPPSPKPSYPTTPVFIPHEPPSIVSHAPGLVDEYLLGDYDDYEVSQGNRSILREVRGNGAPDIPHSQKAHNEVDRYIYF